MLSADAIWKLKDAEFEALLDSCALKPQSSTIRFYAPSFMYYRTKQFCSSTNEFPTISITGNSCALKCKHCGGKVLETMHPAFTPKMLFDLGRKLKSEGAKGVLISGGCLPDGSIPLEDFSPVLARFKHELGLTVFVHTGIITPKTAALLKSADIDAALIDVLGSQQTIQNTLNLNVTVQDYALSLQALNASGIAVIPHVIVGLNNGHTDGELQALKIILQNCRPAAIVIIAFMPIHGTQMANTQPPNPIDIAKTAAAARTTFPNTPLLLGCMRPKGKPRTETDILALKAGVDGIAFPSYAAIEYAKTHDHRIEFSSFCCAQMYLDCRM
ncbi:MAG: radical SAM protein [Candidatus Bathyarchaeota archaeon]|nr:radical SAM protein [Candidatus Bathyarchaeota archaeon]